MRRRMGTNPRPQRRPIVQQVNRRPYRGFRFVNFRYVVLTLLALLLQYCFTKYTGYKLDISFTNIRRVLFDNKANDDLMESSLTRNHNGDDALQPDDYDQAAFDLINHGKNKDGAEKKNAYKNIDDKTCNSNSNSNGGVDNVCSEDNCILPIPPSSSFTTHCIHIGATSVYQGRAGPNHRWSYEIKFTNNGDDTVQMLARHWIFTDNEGVTNELKGPGAKGDTPIIRPGDSWKYRSSAILPTFQGSMSGTFQMEILKFGGIGSTSCTAIISNDARMFFSATVQRLSLTGFDSLPVSVPCGDPAKNHWIPSTSVRSTQRIIVGATCKYIQQKDLKYIFQYDIQINNVRTKPIRMLSHLWKLKRLGNTAMGAKAPLIVDNIQGEGLGGFHDIGVRRILPGKAFRYLGTFEILTKKSLVSGIFQVKLGYDQSTLNVNIGELACSIDDRPMDPGLYE